MKTRFLAGTGLFLLSLAAISCGRSGPELAPENPPQFYVDAQGGNPSATHDTIGNPFPHLKFASGQISLNDRCPVRRVPLNVRLPALYVNGRPIGFC